MAAELRRIWLALTEPTPKQRFQRQFGVGPKNPDAAERVKGRIKDLNLILAGLPDRMDPQFREQVMHDLTESVVVADSFELDTTYKPEGVVSEESGVVKST